MSRKTIITGTGERYSGLKCPACPAVLQPAAPVGGGPRSERVGLEQHWLVVHPERPFKATGRAMSREVMPDGSKGDR